MYQAEIIMGMPSDHAYGDMRGLKRRTMKKRKKEEKKSHRYSHCCIVSSVSCLTKSKRGQRIEYRRRNSEAGCSISSLASDSSQQSSPESFEAFTANYCRVISKEAVGNSWDILTPFYFTNIRRIIQNGSYEAGGRGGGEGGGKGYICVLQCAYASFRYLI